METPTLEPAVVPEAAPDPKAAKRANFEAYLANVHAGTIVATNKPVQLHLEVSSRCNLRCKKCGFSWDPSLAASGRDLPWPILARMDEFFAAAVEVHTFGYGEMFLYPELAPLVTVLKNHGCRLSGITNGVLIRPADVVWLVACGYDQLTFSIDGATEETMDKLRGASLAKVLHVLHLIHDEKERRKSEFPRIVVNFVAQNDNFRELPDLARQLGPLGIYFMGVNPLHHFFETAGAYGPYYESFRLSRAPRAEFEDAVSQARAIMESTGTTFQNFVNPDFEWSAERPTVDAGVPLHNRKLPEVAASPESAPEASSSDAFVQDILAAAAAPALPAVAQAEAPASALSPMYCHYPWTTLYLSAAGKARVCCYMNVHEDLGAFTGDANIGTAWNGPQLQSVREHIRDGRVHPACRECVSHRTFEVHAAAMYPIREELGLAPVAPVPVPASAPVVEPQPEDDPGMLRRFLKRLRRPDGDGAGGSL